MLDTFGKLGSFLIEFLHHVGLLILTMIVVWAAGASLLDIFNQDVVSLKDILLFFIYLELLAMIGVYYRTHRMPVQYLIFIAITALSRHLVIDVQQVSDTFHLYLLLTIAGAILLLSISLFTLTYTSKRFGRPEDHLKKRKSKK
ncbi:MAG: phosphate-starvation-inducible protein PsiE [bacterium]